MNPSAGRITLLSPDTRGRHGARLCLAAMVVATGLVGGGCQFLDMSSDRHVQTDWSNPEVGQMAMRMYLRAHPLSQQAEQKQLLEQVGSRLGNAAHRPGFDWRFELVDDPQPDIVVFPGGNVVVTEGMIAACHNEAEFAAALAHELGHMLAGHPMRDPPPALPGLSHQPDPHLAERAEQDEIEADSIALSLLAQAGYDPRALVEFWRHADANPERIAFVDSQANREPQLAELSSSLAQAQQLYRVNPRKQGLGIRIVRDESARSTTPPTAAVAAAPLREVHWTASSGPVRPTDPIGATKPDGWNDDLLEEGDWMLPVESDIQQAGFDWMPVEPRD